jgi:hypothetical protein
VWLEIRATLLCALDSKAQSNEARFRLRVTGVNPHYGAQNRSVMVEARLGNDKISNLTKVYYNSRNASYKRTYKFIRTFVLASYVLRSLSHSQILHFGNAVASRSYQYRYD